MPSEVSLFYAVEMSDICQESVICFLPVLSGGWVVHIGEVERITRRAQAERRPISNVCACEIGHAALRERNKAAGED